MQPYRTPDPVHSLYNCVLVRSVLSYRHTLRLLDGHAARSPSSRHYIREMRTTLALMEQELSRRRQRDAPGASGVRCSGIPAPGGRVADRAPSATSRRILPERSSVHHA